jgi:hypothetical protein
LNGIADARWYPVEETVKTRELGWPVEVFVGLGFPREITTVLAAFQLLNEWSGTRGPLHQPAHDACRAALIGKGDDASARQAFVEFARDRHILAPEALAASALQFAHEWMSA